MKKNAHQDAVPFKTTAKARQPGSPRRAYLSLSSPTMAKAEDAITLKKQQKPKRRLKSEDETPGAPITSFQIAPHC